MPKTKISTRKISISQLRPGMFVHELDLSWMQTPFLRHRRKIDSDNDIALLKKAGVKALTIDLTRGADVQDETDALNDKDKEAADKQEPHLSQTSAAQKQPERDLSQISTAEAGSEPIQEKQIPLNEELKVAKALQGKIEQLVDQLGALVKEGHKLSVEAIEPVINEARQSLERNDQALLTMLHLYRKDIKLSDHGFGVFAVVLPLAMRMKCTEDEVKELGMAALLHDTGWSRFPMHLVGKNKAYTEAELSLIQQHPDIIEEVLNKTPDFPENVKILVKQHHETADGNGYPDKLKKNLIHEMVEILQVADFYDESIHGLTDKPGMIPAKALKLLYQAGRKGIYSEIVVSQLIHVIGIYPVTSAVQLSTGEKGLVIEVNKHKPLLPKVKIVYEADGKQCRSEKIVDLVSPPTEDSRLIKKVIVPLDDIEDPLGLLRVTDVKKAS